MTRVDFKQGVLQGGPGKLEKWVLCCQRCSEAGYIVLERACSVFKRPHKTLTALPLFYTHSPKHKEIWDTREENTPAVFLSCVNPVVTAVPSRPIFLWCSWNSFNRYLLQILFSTFFPSVVYARASSHPLAFVSSKFFLFLLPTSRRWTGITRTFPDSSWRTPVCAWVLAVYLSIC